MVPRMDVSSGVFALGGVALGGVLAEFRAWKDASDKRAQDLLLVRRETYARALRQIETLASTFTQWVEGPDPKTTRPVWDAMTAAYETFNETRLIVEHLEDTEIAFNSVLRVYRNPLERGDRQVVSAGDERKALVELFREDLAM
jgi:hypothetical protein